MIIYVRPPDGGGNLPKWIIILITVIVVLTLGTSIYMQCNGKL